MQIGCVRLTERHGTDLDAAAAAVRAALPRLPFAVHTLLGVDGTTAEAAALRGTRELGAADVEAELRRLGAATSEERRSLLQEPDRGEVIVMGVLILRELLCGLGAERVVVCERDVLNGAVLEAAALGTDPEGDAPAGAYTCC
jgi:exopolyphosphatase/guanosine-5'-triphosphate,3'-diphosphate pyrophosphatase